MLGDAMNAKKDANKLSRKKMDINKIRKCGFSRISNLTDFSVKLKKCKKTTFV